MATPAVSAARTPAPKHCCPIGLCEYLGDAVSDVMEHMWKVHRARLRPEQSIVQVSADRIIGHVSLDAEDIELGEKLLGIARQSEEVASAVASAAVTPLPHFRKPDLATQPTARAAVSASVQPIKPSVPSAPTTSAATGKKSLPANPTFVPRAPSSVPPFSLSEAKSHATSFPYIPASAYVPYTFSLLRAPPQPVERDGLPLQWPVPILSAGVESARVSDNNTRASTTASQTEWDWFETIWQQHSDLVMANLRTFGAQLRTEITARQVNLPRSESVDQRECEQRTAIAEAEVARLTARIREYESIIGAMEAAPDISKQKLTQLEHDNECSICLDIPANTAVIPCGHRDFCYVCLSQQQQKNNPCPKCNGVIRGILRLY